MIQKNIFDAPSTKTIHKDNGKRLAQYRQVESTVAKIDSEARAQFKKLATRIYEYDKYFCVRCDSIKTKFILYKS